MCVCWFGRTSGYNTTCIQLDFDSLISSNKVKDQRKRERNRIWKKKSTRWVIGSLRFFPRSRRFSRRIAPRKLLLLRPPSPLMSQRFETNLLNFFLFNPSFMCWKLSNNFFCICASYVWLIWCLVCRRNTTKPLKKRRLNFKPKLLKYMRLHQLKSRWEHTYNTHTCIYHNTRNKESN